MPPVACFIAIGIELVQKRVAFCTLVSVLLFGCASTDQGLAEDVQFKNWQLIKVDTNSIASSAHVRFIDAMEIEGHTGCNDFFASSAIFDEQLRVDNLGMTYKVCEQVESDVEQALLQTLKSNPAVVVGADTMVLTGAHTLTFQALPIQALPNQ